MAATLEIGTIRGFEDPFFVMQTKRGERLRVRIHGEQPRVGDDVVGQLRREAGGHYSLRCGRQVMDTLLDGDVSLHLVGDGEVTADLLGRILSARGNAIIRPGEGACIRRSVKTDNASIAWALDMFGPVADRAGLALNVIDPRSLADQATDAEALRSMLPADQEGQIRALKDLRHVVRTGFHPICSTSIDRISRSPSVNFVVPYSPYVTGAGYCKLLAHMVRDEELVVTLSTDEARRFSTARQVAMALSHLYFTEAPFRDDSRDAASSAWISHRVSVYADAAAALACLRHGDRPEILDIVATARDRCLIENARLDRGHAGMEAWSAPALRALDGSEGGGDGFTLLAEAAAFAEANALPERAFRQPVPPVSAMAEASLSDGDVVDVVRLAYDARQPFRDRYRDHLNDAIGHAGISSPAALERFSMFASLITPSYFETILDERIAQIADGMGLSETVDVAIDLVMDDEVSVPRPAFGS